MRTLASLGCVGLVVVSVAVACAGDDAKHVRAGDGGAAGRGEGGAAGLGQGAGESDPLGGAGSPSGGAGLGGAGLGGAGLGGSGGVAAVAGAGGSGAPGSDGGAGGAVDCRASEDTNYTCLQVEADWAPVWNPIPGRFEFDVSSLPVPIASGTVSYFVNNADFQECGTVDIQVNGDLVYAPITIANVKLTPTDVRVSTFSFIDVCGNHRDFDPRGVPACNDLRAEVSFGSASLTCTTRFDATCPEACVPPG